MNRNDILYYAACALSGIFLVALAWLCCGRDSYAAERAAASAIGK